MFARPKPGENEEDILALQEAYMREKEKNKDFTPSAKVVNLRKHKSPPEPSTSAKQSKYAQSKGLNKKSRVTFHEEATIIGDVSEKETEPYVEDDKVYYPNVIPSVLGDIIERNYDRTHFDYRPSSSNASGGFPSPKKRDTNGGSVGSKSPQGRMKSPPPVLEDTDDMSGDFVNVSNGSSDSKVSSYEDSLNMSMESTEGKPIDITSKYFEKSVILQGDNAEDIHNENKNTLKKMSEEELLEEREKLMSTLDPKVLDFIKSLRNKNGEANNRQDVEMKPAEKFTETKTLPDETNGNGGVKMKDLSGNDVIKHPDLKKWVHFDTLETDKLQWIQNMEEFQNTETSDEPYEARFDFKGYLQSYSMEYTEETKTLFHHGEDPHRPGYSLNELFQLCRSTVTQQRVLALNTIAGILEYNSIGIYENVIDIPITKIYFVLRFALDENIPVVLEPTLKALRNMFYNKIDEACLDFLLSTEKGLIQPRLVSTKSEKSETESDLTELKDFHLVDLDLVNGAIRTDLIPRLRYILTTVKPSFVSVECILQIFTRIFRESVENAELLFNTEGLMDFIFENYLPRYISNSLPSGQDLEHCKLILSTLKMVRIAVSQSKAIAEICCSKYNIFLPLLNYIANVVVENTLLLKIQVEVFYLWSNFIYYGLGLGCLCDIKGLLLRVLDNHAKATDLIISYPVLMHSHVAALMTLLTFARLAKEKYPQSLPNDYFDEFIPIMMFIFRKWSNQMESFMSYTAGHLKSVSALLTFMSTNHELEFEKFDKMTEINTYLHDMFQCDGFLVQSSSLMRNSNILSKLEIGNYTKRVCETNIPGLYASVISKSQNVLPLLTVTSPICFLVALSKYILISKDKQLYWEFIQHNVVFEYIRAISKTKKINFSDNWFTKLELDFLCNIIYLSIDLDISDVTKDILYSFAFKLTYILSAEYKPVLLFILERIVFSKNWFTVEKLLRNLDIEEASGILNHLNDIFECYTKVLNLSTLETLPTLTASNWSQKVLPRDWFFMPILGLYSKSQELENSKIPKELVGAKEEYIKHIVTCSLKWILVSEIYFPEITNEISLTDRFCRLCCIFLCDNSLFLDPTIKPLLRKCVKIIFNIENSPLCYSKFNFDKSVLGINSFQDFYTQLVDQFQAVSYGDPTFAACVLAPLAQKHNVKWRKLVWSEYAACLRALDCPKEYLCYKIEQYLDPPEKDMSLLKCYHQALLSNLLRTGTVPHQIAQEHVDYVRRIQRRDKM